MCDHGFSRSCTNVNLIVGFWRPDARISASSSHAFGHGRAGRIQPLEQLGTKIVPLDNAADLQRRTDGSLSGNWGPFELRSAFQPIFAFRNKNVNISAYEAMMRPFLDDRPVPLATFFPRVPLDERAAVEAMARRVHLFNAGKSIGNEASLFINFNPSLFADGADRLKALDEMRDILAEVKLKPSRIVCEVTEQESTSERLLLDFVNALRKEGYRIAVDD